MKLVRYNPLNEFVPSTFGSLLESALLDGRSEFFSPNVDFVKNEDSFELHLVAPGLEISDFTLDLQDNVLTISGERKLNEDINFSKVESRYGKFKRSFKMSELVATDKIEASYNSGILKVVLPLDKKKVEKKVIKIS